MKQLESWENLEAFIIKDHSINNGIGWYYNNKALIYFNTGYEAVYTIPDWEKLRLEIIENYKWIENEDNLYEAFHDAVSSYRLFSRG